MIYVKLFFEFLKIGLFSFGGAYGAIPLIQEVVTRNNWADAELFANLVALSEATPGPIMVNMSTYIGNRQAGFSGAVCSTAGVIFPSFIIILIVTTLFRNFLKRRNVQAALKGIKPCLMGIILATGIYMAASVCISEDFVSVDILTCMIFLFLGAVIMLYRRLQKKEFPPIALILLAAVCGAVFYR